MKQKFRNGTLIEVDNGQDKFLKHLYGSTLGRILLKPLVTPVVSKVAGAFLSKFYTADTFALYKVQPYCLIWVFPLQR